MNMPDPFSIENVGLFQARNGEAWRVICLDGNNAEYPVVALDSKGNPNTFAKNGQLRLGRETEFDLVASKPRHVVRWHNVTDDGWISSPFQSFAEADAAQDDDRTGVLCITHENGKLVSAVIEP